MKFVAIMAAAAMLSASPALGQEQPALDPKSLEAALATNPQGSEAERLADRIRQAFGGRDALLRGAQPLIDELTVAWAIDLPGRNPAPNLPSPRVWRPVGNAGYPMTQIGTTGVYALVRTFAHGDAFTWTYDAGGNWRLGSGTIEVYQMHPDARVRAGVPKGTLKQMPQWHSKVFPG